MILASKISAAGSVSFSPNKEILFSGAVAGGTYVQYQILCLSRLNKLRLPMQVLGGMSGAQGCKDLLIQIPGLKLHGQPSADLPSNTENTADWNLFCLIYLPLHITTTNTSLFFLAMDLQSDSKKKVSSLKAFSWFSKFKGQKTHLH